MREKRKSGNQETMVMRMQKNQMKLKLKEANYKNKKKTKIYITIKKSHHRVANVNIGFRQTSNHSNT